MCLACIPRFDAGIYIDWPQLRMFYLKTETESSLRNVVLWKINRMMFMDKDRTVENVHRPSDFERFDVRKTWNSNKQTKNREKSDFEARKSKKGWPKLVCNTEPCREVASQYLNCEQKYQPFLNDNVMLYFRKIKKLDKNNWHYTGFSPKKTQAVVMLMNHNSQLVDSR
jgi:hypothetical protein